MFLYLLHLQRWSQSFFFFFNYLFMCLKCHWHTFLIPFQYVTQWFAKSVCCAQHQCRYHQMRFWSYIHAKTVWCWGKPDSSRPRNNKSALRQLSQLSQLKLKLESMTQDDNTRSAWDPGSDSLSVRRGKQSEPRPSVPRTTASLSPQAP